MRLKWVASVLLCALLSAARADGRSYDIVTRAAAVLADASFAQLRACLAAGPFERPHVAGCQAAYSRTMRTQAELETLARQPHVNRYTGAMMPPEELLAPPVLSWVRSILSTHANSSGRDATHAARRLGRGAALAAASPEPLQLTVPGSILMSEEELNALDARLAASSAQAPLALPGDLRQQAAAWRAHVAMAEWARSPGRSGGGGNATAVPVDTAAGARSRALAMGREGWSGPGPRVAMRRFKEYKGPWFLDEADDSRTYCLGGIKSYLGSNLGKPFYEYSCATGRLWLSSRAVWRVVDQAVNSGTRPDIFWPCIDIGRYEQHLLTRLARGPEDACVCHLSDPKTASACGAKTYRQLACTDYCKVAHCPVSTYISGDPRFIWAQMSLPCTACRLPKVASGVWRQWTTINVGAHYNVSQGYVWAHSLWPHPGWTWGADGPSVYTCKEDDGASGWSRRELSPADYSEPEIYARCRIARVSGGSHPQWEPFVGTYTWGIMPGFRFLRGDLTRTCDETGNMALAQDGWLGKPLELACDPVQSPGAPPSHNCSFGGDLGPAAYRASGILWERTGRRGRMVYRNIEGWPESPLAHGYRPGVLGAVRLTARIAGEAVVFTMSNRSNYVQGTLVAEGTTSFGLLVAFYMTLTYPDDARLANGSIANYAGRPAAMTPPEAFDNVWERAGEALRAAYPSPDFVSVFEFANMASPRDFALDVRWRGGPVLAAGSNNAAEAIGQIGLHEAVAQHFGDFQYADSMDLGVEVFWASPKCAAGSFQVGNDCLACADRTYVNHRGAVRTRGMALAWQPCTNCSGCYYDCESCHKPTGSCDLQPGFCRIENRCRQTNDVRWDGRPGTYHDQCRWCLPRADRFFDSFYAKYNWMGNPGVGCSECVPHHGAAALSA